MYDVIDMPWDWPVDINYHEAKAFCKWKGPDYRLPTEAEHHRMRGDPVRQLIFSILQLPSDLSFILGSLYRYPL